MRGKQNTPRYLASESLGTDAMRLRLGLAVETFVTNVYKVALFDLAVAGFEIDPEMPLDQRRQTLQELHEGLAVYHEALPFSEAERHWVGGVCIAAAESSDGVAKPPVAMDALRSSEAMIICAGRRRAVNGEDLIQRWRSWRRQTGEFADQGSFNVARSGLDRIATSLLSGDRWWH